MSSNSNEENLAFRIAEISQIPSTFAQVWTDMGGDISDERYITALGKTLSLKFAELAQQWSLTNAGTDPQRAPHNGQPPPEQWTNSPSVDQTPCDLSGEQQPSTLSKTTRAFSLPAIEAIKSEFRTSPFKSPSTSPAIHPTSLPPSSGPSSSQSKRPSIAPQSKTARPPFIPTSSHPKFSCPPPTPTMPRTRRMDKISAVNKAKTRGEKARALNTDSGRRVVMESVTIPVARRAPKRTRNAGEPVDPARPPKPAAVQDEEQAVAAEPTVGSEGLSRPPSPAAVQVEGQAVTAEPTAGSKVQSAILKEGWNLINRYYINEIGPDPVSDYLKTVKDTDSHRELTNGFSAAMNDEDEEARQFAAVLIAENLKKFDRAPDTPREQVANKKRKTTFKPHFTSAPEDSASRPPTDSTPQRRTPNRSPTPFPNYRSPSSSPSPSLPNSPRRLEFASSSLPPSSPSPTDLALEIGPMVETLRTQTGGMELDASALFDDEDKAVAVKTPPKKAKNRKGKASASAIEQKDNIADEEGAKSAPKKNRKGKAAASVEQNAEQVKAAPEKKKKGKGKGSAAPVVQNVEQVKAAHDKTKKGKAPTSAVEQTPNTSDEEGEEDEGKAVKKPGRLSKATIEQAHALRQTYHDELEALAQKDGKSVAALLAAVGDTVLDSRALNPWNAFQAYATHPEGLAMARKEDQSIPEFNSDILAAYRRKRAEAKDSEDEFAEILEWYQKQLHEQTAKGRREGLTYKQLDKIVNPFNARGRQAYEFHGASVFGFIVDPVSRRARAFGADPLFLAMKESNPSHLSGQLEDYGSMLHIELMKKKGRQFLHPAKEVIVRRFHSAGSDHEALRAILKDIWLHNLNEVVGRNSNIKQLQWGRHFADLCYTYKVKLVNYPIGLKALGVPNGLQGVSKMNIAKHVKPIVQDFVRFWQQEADAKKAELVDKDDSDVSLYADDDDDGEYDEKQKKRRVFEEDLVRFVSWDEDELDMDIADEAYIGIVLEEPQGGDEPRVLAKVLHSKKFLARAADRQVVIKGSNDDQEGGSGSEGESDGDRAQNKKGHQAGPPKLKRKAVASPLPKKKKTTAPPPANKRKSTSDEKSEADDATPLPKKKPTAPPPAKERTPTSDEESEADDAPPLPKKRTTALPPAKKRQPISDEESEGDIAPPPRKKHTTALPPAPKTKVRSQDIADGAKAPQRKAHTAVMPPKAGPSRIKEDRPIAPRPQPRPINQKRSVVYSSDDEEEVEERPAKRARVEQPDRKRANGKSQGETRPGGTKRKRGKK